MVFQPFGWWYLVKDGLIKVLQNRSFALSRLFTNVSVYAGERKSERSEREAHGVLRGTRAKTIERLYTYLVKSGLIRLLPL